MFITIRRQSVDLPPEEADLLHRRLNFALGRFSGYIRKVIAYIGDVNGPRGGIDKRCRLVAEVAGTVPVTVEARDGCFGRMFADAAERLAQAVSRHVARARRWYRPESRRPDLP